MPVTEKIGRRQAIPIIYTRGTHYEIGYDVGRTFGALIHSFLKKATALNEEYLPAYETPEGRKAYDDTLEAVKTNFPQYVQELEGTADGAQVPFHKLFLLHMDNIILSNLEEEGKKLPTGCSTIMVNQKGQEILGHTEDALCETLNHFYFVSAHIISDKPQGKWKVKEEHFTSLCYAGHLPGYTMGYNHHGLVYSINTLSAKKLVPGKIPRHFISRALLSSKNFAQAQQILRDPGCGAGDGCSVNLTFLGQEDERNFYNIEMAPAVDSTESKLNILTVPKGDHSLHCNAYLRLPTAQVSGLIIDSSIERMNTFNNYPKPTCKDDVIKMLSDHSAKDHPVFREVGQVFTIAVGIFDCIEKTWSLYSDNPSKNDPLVTIPLVLECNKISK